MNKAKRQRSLDKALNVIKERVQELGYTHISPQAMVDLGDRLFTESEEVCRAYRQVVEGFRSLLAPKEAA